MLRPLALAVLLALAGGAAAQPAPGPGGPRRLFISPSGEPFRGGDGLQAWFAGADADHDGRLTPAEFRADALRFFKSLDTDGDGRLDGFELQAYEQDRVPEITGFSFDEQPRGEGRGGGRPHRGEGGGRRGRMGASASRGGGGHEGAGPGGAGREGAARFSLIDEPQPVMSADADLDGRVTMREWLAITERRFARLDRAKAGELSVAGLQALRPPGKGRRQAATPPPGPPRREPAG